MDEIWDAGTAPSSTIQGADDSIRIDKVVRWGLAALQEQPLLVVLGGLNVVMVLFVPGLLSTPISAAISVAAELDEGLIQAVDIAVSLGLNLLAWPVQTLVLAGLIAGIGHYIARDEVSIASLYTSFGGALRALLYGVFSSVVTLFVYFLFLAPGLAACFGAVMTLESDESTAILLTLLGAVLVLAGIVAFVPISLGLVLGIVPAVLDGAGPFEALALSWEAARGNRLHLLGIVFLFGICSFIGACCCYLPAAPVYGVHYAGLTAAWLRYSRPDEVTTGWRFFRDHGT